MTPATKSHRRLGRAWGLLLVAAVASGCLDDFTSPVATVIEVRRIASVAKPTHRAFGASPVTTLPIGFRNAARQEHQSIWFQARIALDQTPTGTWAVYVPRFAQGAEIYVNGRWIGSSGRITSPLSRNWNRPLLLRMPQRMLHKGENTVDLHLVLQKTAPAFLTPFFVGPETQLGPAYRTRFFLQITCARYGAVAMAAIAMILGFVAMQRSEFPQFRFFALGCLAWAFGSSELFIQSPPVAPRTWQILTMGGAGLSMILFVQTSHGSFQRHRTRLEIGLYATLGALLLSLALVPDRLFEATAGLLWGFCFAVSAYLGSLFIFGKRPSSLPRTRALVVLGVAGALIAVHDILLGLFIPVKPSFFLVPALSIAAALWGAWVVIDYFVGALRESETLNRELEDRVAAKHAELETNYRRVRDLERQSVVSTERERLMREMHDGMGGQLVSALAMAEDGQTSPKQVADVIRDALDDMRLVIDSLDPVIGDIPTLLGMIRGRVEPRLKVHGLRFDWRVTDLPPTPHFGPEQFLNVLRIAQEAITNIVKHAEATVIRVETETARGDEGRPGIRVSIGDDGKGLGDTATNGGRGLANMQTRAARLGGSVAIVGETMGGTTVRLWMPIDADPPLET